MGVLLAIPSVTVEGIEMRTGKDTISTLEGIELSSWGIPSVL